MGAADSRQGIDNASHSSVVSSGRRHRVKDDLVKLKVNTRTWR